MPGGLNNEMKKSITPGMKNCFKIVMLNSVSGYKTYSFRISALCEEQSMTAWATEKSRMEHEKVGFKTQSNDSSKYGP